MIAWLGYVQPLPATPEQLEQIRFVEVTVVSKGYIAQVRENWPNFSLREARECQAQTRQADPGLWWRWRHGLILMPKGLRR